MLRLTEFFQVVNNRCCYHRNYRIIEITEESKKFCEIGVSKKQYRKKRRKDSSKEPEKPFESFLSIFWVMRKLFHFFSSGPYLLLVSCSLSFTLLVPWFQVLSLHITSAGSKPYLFDELSHCWAGHPYLLFLHPQPASLQSCY
jgi:hypothetical protein